MLFKAILDLRQEVNALKSAVYGTVQEPARSLPTPEDHSVRNEPDTLEAEWQDSEVQANTSQPATVDLSLQKVSEDLIRKALEKHDGNRKLAAAELGISERTLYRRLSKETSEK